MYTPRIVGHCVNVIDEASITIATATSCCGEAGAEMARGKVLSPDVDGAAMTRAACSDYPNSEPLNDNTPGTLVTGDNVSRRAIWSREVFTVPTGLGFRFTALAAPGIREA